MLLVIEENAHYQNILKDLIEKVHDQEGSIRHLHEICQLVDDSLPRATEDPNFEKN